MLTFWIYLIGISDTLRLAAAILTVLLVLSCIFGMGMSADFHAHDEKAKERDRKILKTFLYSAVFCLCVAVFTPNGKTLAAMFVIPSVVQNEKLQNIAGNSLSALEKLTANWLKDLSKDSLPKLPEKSI